MQFLLADRRDVMIPFDEKELEILGYSNSFRSAQVPVYRYPVSMKEAYRLALAERKPVWMLTGAEVRTFCPDIIPDNRARGFVFEAGTPLTDEEKGGKDMFGIEWVYVPIAGGSMEKPGVKPLFEDANDWEQCISWPDIDSWDWAGSAENNRAYLQGDSEAFNSVMLLNGFGFERLISFMGFENAAMALLDEEQEAALKALFDRLSDLYCRIIDKCCEYYEGVDGFHIHDDWGSQRAPFFSAEIGREFLVPYMRKVTDHIHALGKIAELHSCGCNELHIQNFIDAGWDSWSPMGNINDTQMLFEKYGDKIVLGVMPDTYDVSSASSEEIRAEAIKFVERFCGTSGKVCILNRAFAPWMTEEYLKEVYKASRNMYGKMN